MKEVKRYPDNQYWSEAVVVDGIVYVKGAVAKDLETKKPFFGTIEEETTRILENMETMLKSYGSGMDKLIKVDIYLREYKYYDRMNRAWDAFFTDKEHLPTRLCFGNVDIFDVSKVEMVATAYI